MIKRSRAMRLFNWERKSIASATFTKPKKVLYSPPKDRLMDLRKFVEFKGRIHKAILTPMINNFFTY